MAAKPMMMPAAPSKTVLDWIAFVLVIVGGLNWGLVGLFGFDLVAWLFGAVAWLQILVYLLVGVAALYMIFYLFKE